ncbi:MAG: FAD/NAD(P)-binding protein [Deltaproteobacteria bacterium]|nr:FAD/NAD(P)-binding protein [Deltaproteobacteria bacterium]
MNENITVAIIGAGASGTILANQIIEKTNHMPDVSVTVFLIEKGRDFGPGLAYSTPLSSHILNMRADTLGVEKDNPCHFVEWLKEHENTGSIEFGSESYDINYPPRKVYGQYLKNIIDEAVKKTVSGQCRLELINGEAVDIEHNGSGFRLQIEGGSMISVDYAVLAPGNFPSSFLHELKGKRGYIHYPWPVSIITENIPRDNPVCILGTGLSAIDTLFTLLENDHRGKITFLSRRGFLPKVQGKPFEYQLKYINKQSISEAGSALHENHIPFDRIKDLYFREMEASEEKNIDWLQVFNPGGSIEQILEKDIIRAESGIIFYQAALTATGPLTGYIWNSLSAADRMLFDTNYKTLWTVYRHPMPLVNAKKILKAIKSGQLDILSGCTCVRTCGEEGFEIDVSTRFGIPYAVKIPAVINATGQGLDVKKYNNPLINRLIEKGLINPHPNGGIFTDFDSSEVRGKDGNRVPGLFALGEITRGVHFFTNGIVPNMSSSGRIADYILRGGSY